MSSRLGGDSTSKFQSSKMSCIADGYDYPEHPKSAGHVYSPRRPMILALSSASRPSRYAFASRVWTQRPRPRAGSYEENGTGPGNGRSGPVRSVPLVGGELAVRVAKAAPWIKLAIKTNDLRIVGYTWEASPRFARSWWYSSRSTREEQSEA